MGDRRGQSVIRVASRAIQVFGSIGYSLRVRDVTSLRKRRLIIVLVQEAQQAPQFGAVARNSNATIIRCVDNDTERLGCRDNFLSGKFLQNSRLTDQRAIER